MSTDAALVLACPSQWSFHSRKRGNFRDLLNLVIGRDGLRKGDTFPLRNSLSFGRLRQIILALRRGQGAKQLLVHPVIVVSPKVAIHNEPVRALQPNPRFTFRKATGRSFDILHNTSILASASSRREVDSTTGTTCGNINKILINLDAPLVLRTINRILRSSPPFEEENSTSVGVRIRRTRGLTLGRGERSFVPKARRLGAQQSRFLLGSVPKNTPGRGGLYSLTTLVDNAGLVDLHRPWAGRESATMTNSNNLHNGILRYPL